MHSAASEAEAADGWAYGIRSGDAADRCDSLSSR